jgi:hypothetical protein
VTIISYFSSTLGQAALVDNPTVEWSWGDCHQHPDAGELTSVACLIVVDLHDRPPSNSS